MKTNLLFIALMVACMSFLACQNQQNTVDHDDMTFRIAEFAENFVKAKSINDACSIASRLGWVKVSETGTSAIFASSEDKAKALRKSTELSQKNAFAFPYIEVQVASKSVTIDAYDALKSQSNALVVYKNNSLWCHNTLTKYNSRDWWGVTSMEDIHEGYYEGNERNKYKGLHDVLGGYREYFSALTKDIFHYVSELDEVVAMEDSCPEYYDCAGYTIVVSGGSSLVEILYSRTENRN